MSVFIGPTYSMKVTVLKCIMFLRTSTIRYFRLRALKLPGSCVSQRILQGFMLCYGLEKDRTLSAEQMPLNYTDQIPTFKIFKGLLIVDLNLFFQPPARRGLRGHPYKVLQGAGHRRRRGLAFSARVVKYCNKLPAYSPLCQCFQEKVGEKCD